MWYRYAPLVLLLLSLPVAAQDGWRFTAGPTTGHVTALTTTPDGEVFAGTYQGLCYSTDGGATWTMTITHPYARLARALDVVPGRHLFVGIEQPDFFKPENVHGVVRVYPLDGGGTPGYTDGAWGAAGTTVEDIEAEADGRGWAAIGRQVFTYRPASDTWVAADLPVARVTDLHRVDGALLAATVDGLFRSDDDGATWSPYALDGQSLHAVTVSASGTLFAADRFGLVYRSDDGVTWTPISCGGVVLDLYPLPDGTVVGGTDGLGLVRTVNDGWNWEYMGGTEVVPDVAGDRAGVVYAVAAEDGLRSSSDSGASWEARRWVDANVRHLLARPDGSVVAVSASHYGAHAFQADAWIDLGLDGEEVQHALAAGPHLYAMAHEGTFGTAVLRSDDGGQSWTNVRSFEYYTTLSGGTDGRLFTAGHDGVLYSDDGGSSWEALSGTPLPGTVLPVDDGLLFSYTQGYPDALLRSTDNGTTWTNLGSPTFDKSVLPRLNAVLRTADGALLAADADRLMRSVDDGLVWEPLDGSPGHVVALLQEGSGVLWAARSEGYAGPGAARGVWRSEDGGTTWTAAGLEDLRVHALAMAADGALLAGTEAGVYTQEGSVVEIENGPVADLPGGYALSPVYPNPFNPSARFTLTVAEAQAVTVAVFDALGRRVVVLHDGLLAAGAAHAFTLDGANLPSGVYVVRATGEAFGASRIATLLK